MKRAVVAAEPVEGPWELPDGWKWIRLAEACEPSQYGWTTSAAPSGSVKFLRTTDISSGRVNWNTVPYCAENPPKVDKYRLKSGDILISRAGSVGKSFLIDEADNAVFASYLIRYRPKCVPRYLHYYLQSPAYWSRIADDAAGIAIQNVNATKLDAIPFPFAPEAEQRCIAGRIDELFAEIDDGERALAAAREGVETYRKSLLKAAVTGELTADWRNANPPAETGEDLLSRILTERRAKWMTDPKTGGKRYTEPSGPTVDDLSELPETWCWASMDQLLWGIEAGLNVKAEGRPPSLDEPGIVKISAVTWDEFDENESKTLLAGAATVPRDLIRPGDFLFSRANTLELVGAPAIVRQIKRRLFLSDKVLRFRLSDDLKEWVYYFLKSPHGRREIESRSTGNQLSMRNIPQEGIRAIRIPIPPAHELQVLIADLAAGWDARRDLSETLEFEGHAGLLRQSILAAAFRGDLA